MTEKKENATSPGAIEKSPNGAGTKVCLKADFGDVYSIIAQVPGQGLQLMAPVKADMMLYEKLGHFYKIAGKYDSETRTKEIKYNITRTGYTHLNKVPSISILSPQQLIVDGRPVPNPMIERDPKTRVITAVNIRKMGVGYSPAGNLVVVDKTLFYNVYTYFIQSIQKKMGQVEWKEVGGKRVKTTNRENPDCACYGIAGAKPTKAGLWYFLPMEGELGIWINYEDPAIIDCLEEHTQRQRFGDRIAQAIVERNILKDHPAIGVSQVFAKETPEGMRATVTVYGYRIQNTPHDLSKIVRQTEEGESTKDFEVKAEVLSATDVEEEKAAMEETARGENMPEEDGDPARDDAPPEGYFERKRKEAA